MLQRFHVQLPNEESHIYLHANLPEKEVRAEIDKKFNNWIFTNYHNNKIYNMKKLARGSLLSSANPYLAAAQVAGQKIGQGAKKVYTGVKKAGKYAWEAGEEAAPAIWEQSQKTGKKIVSGTKSFFGDISKYSQAKLSEYSKYALLQTKEAKKEFNRTLKRYNQGVLKSNGKKVNSKQKALQIAMERAVAIDDQMIGSYKTGGIIKFNKFHLPDSRIYEYAAEIKENYPKVWALGGNIFGNTAFINLKRVIKRGYWLDSEEWMYKKWQSFIRRHAGNKNIKGVIANLKWLSYGDKGTEYAKEIIKNAVDKYYPKNKLEHGGTVYPFMKKQEYFIGDSVAIEQNNKWIPTKVVKKYPHKEKGRTFTYYELQNQEGAYLADELFPYEPDKMKEGGIIPNNEGGFTYTGKNEKTAKEVDLITLPEKVEGTHCLNCMYIVNVRGNEGFCWNPKILLPVTKRMCCALWDNLAVERSWQFKKGGIIELSDVGNLSDGNIHNWNIILTEQKVPIGNIAFSINRHTAEVHYIIADDARNRGYMIEAVREFAKKVKGQYPKVRAIEYFAHGKKEALKVIEALGDPVEIDTENKTYSNFNEAALDADLPESQTKERIEFNEGAIRLLFDMPTFNAGGLTGGGYEPENNPTRAIVKTEKTAPGIDYILLASGEITCDEFDEEPLASDPASETFEVGGLIIDEISTNKAKLEKAYELHINLDGGDFYTYFRILFEPMLPSPIGGGPKGGGCGCPHTPVAYRPFAYEIDKITNREGVELKNIREEHKEEIEKAIENFRITQADASEWVIKKEGGNVPRYTFAEKKQIAATMLSQIGAKTLMYIGYNSPMVGEDENGNPYLIFKASGAAFAKNQSLHIQITLVNDEYEVQGFTVRNYERKPVKTFTHVYAEDLADRVMDITEWRMAKGGVVDDLSLYRIRWKDNDSKEDTFETSKYDLADKKWNEIISDANLSWATMKKNTFTPDGSLIGHVLIREIHKNAKGGMTIGPSHEEGGVKFKVKSTGQLVELEGGEPVINATNADSDEKIIFTRPVTVKEAASCMNEIDGNGVNFRGENTPCPIKKVNE